MIESKKIALCVSLAVGLLQFNGLFSFNLQKNEGRRALKKQVQEDIKNDKWIEAAEGIEKFEAARLPRFAIDLRQEFANAYTKAGTVPVSWPSVVKQTGRQQVKKLIKQALKNEDFGLALAGIKKMPDRTRRDLYKIFVDAVAVFEEKGTVVTSADEDEEPVELVEGYDDPDELFVAAAQKNDLPLMKKLFTQKGAHINSINDQSATALMWAAFKGNEEIVQFLLENGANPDLQDNNGTTALMWAAFKGNVPVINLLIKSGADITLKDRRSKTARDYLEGAGHTDALRFFDSLDI